MLFYAEHFENSGCTEVYIYILVGVTHIPRMSKCNGIIKKKKQSAHLKIKKNKEMSLFHESVCWSLV